MSTVLLDVISIAGEVDSQLKQAMLNYVEPDARSVGRRPRPSVTLPEFGLTPNSSEQIFVHRPSTSQRRALPVILITRTSDDYHRISELLLRP